MLGLPESQKGMLQPHINQLEDAGLIIKGEDGKYRLTDKGRLKLERKINERIESVELEASSWIDSSKDIYEEAAFAW